jgi:hypothetical protein
MDVLLKNVDIWLESHLWISILFYILIFRQNRP